MDLHLSLQTNLNIISYAKISESLDELKAIRGMPAACVRELEIESITTDNNTDDVCDIIRRCIAAYWSDRHSDHSESNDNRVERMLDTVANCIALLQPTEWDKELDIYCDMLAAEKHLQ